MHTVDNLFVHPANLAYRHLPIPLDWSENCRMAVNRVFYLGGCLPVEPGATISIGLTKGGFIEFVDLPDGHLLLSFPFEDLQSYDVRLLRDAPDMELGFMTINVRLETRMRKIVLATLWNDAIGGLGAISLYTFQEALRQERTYRNKIKRRAF